MYLSNITGSHVMATVVDSLSNSTKLLRVLTILDFCAMLLLALSF
jgi:hypothetical protein